MSNMNISKVKLNIPQPRNNYIIRQHLFDKLNLAKDYKVLLIKAGAGSGKTTLLSSYLHHYKPKNFKWLSLDEHDNDPFIFWGYFLELLKDYYLDKHDSIAELFNSNMEKSKIKEFLPFLLDQIDLNQEFTFVFDDFHHLKHEYLIDTINYFIKIMPQNIHFIILSRAVNQLSLPTLMMANHLFIIDETDLRFSDSECHLFLKESIKSEAELNIIIKNCGGWIGGLQLLSHAKKRAPLPLNFTSKQITKQILNDYIYHEIFSEFSLATQNFLIETSILSYFNSELYHKYQADKPFHEMIDAIFATNLFILNSDEHGYYSYHGIFSDFLETLFKKQPYQIQVELYQKAAEIYLEIKDYSAAIHLLLLIKDYQKILNLLLTIPQTITNYAYFDKIPLEHIATNINFSIQYFFYCFSNFDEKNCLAIYSLIKQNFPDHKICTLLFNFYAHIIDPKTTLSLKIFPISHIFAFNLTPTITALLLIKEADLLCLDFQYEKSFLYLDEAVKLVDPNKNSYIKYYILFIKAQIYEGLGALNKALQTYAQIGVFDPYPTKITLTYLLGIVGIYIKNFSLNEASNYLEKIKANLTKAPSFYTLGYQYNLAELMFAKGETETAKGLIQELLQFDITNNIQIATSVFKILIYLSKPNDPYIEQYIGLYHKNSQQPNINMSYIYALALSKKGESQKALEILENIIYISRKSKNSYKLIEAILLTIAILKEEKNEGRKLKQLFIEAITYGSENSILFPFCFEKESIIILLNSIKSDFTKDFSAQELHFFEQVKSIVYNQIPQEQPKNELTAREQDILTEIAKGKSNQEIANALYISPATVKSHIINIYGKLGVHNRIAAVNKWLKK